jgi:N-acyl-D-amino-acid deacylase
VSTVSAKRTLLRGGMIADGIGTTIQRADLLIEGDKIAWIGERDSGASEENAEVIDLEPGSVVCPGFIDAHVHAEGPLLEHGVVEGALAQGVTTLVVGQDGESWIGANADTARYLNRYFAPVNGRLEPARDLSVGGYRDAVAGRLVQNVAVLASQGTIRHNVAGMQAGPLDAEQLAEARREVEAALADGAVGLSSGLDYYPSRFGQVDEIAFMAAPLATAGRPYVSHLRGYGPWVRAGLEEIVGVGRIAGIRVHASHLWGAPEDIEPAFAAADSADVPVTFDMYPYRKSSTILAMLLLPSELQTRGPEQTIAALKDPDQRAKLLAYDNFTDEALADLYLGCLPEAFGHLAGMSIAEATSDSSKSAGEWVLDLLVDTELNVGAHLDRPALADEHLTWLANHDRHSAGSDGIYQGQHPHPRGWGTFARLTEQYLAANPETGYQHLARHCATNPANAFGLNTRGRLASNMTADICIIGPNGLVDRAIYGAPTMQATGAYLIFVNGILMHRNGHSESAALPGELVTQ